jgi:hypothetical protein
VRAGDAGGADAVFGAGTLTVTQFGQTYGQWFSSPVANQRNRLLMRDNDIRVIPLGVRGATPSGQGCALAYRCDAWSGPRF